MGIEKLKSSLLSEANKESETIIEGAQAQVKAIMEEERAKSASMKAEAEKEVKRLLEEQRNERTAWARLEAKRILAEAKEDAIKGVLEDFFDVLVTMRKSPEYKKFLNNAVNQAASELGGKVVIHVAKGEGASVPKLKDAKVVEDLEGLGGAIVESVDGKVSVNLTLEMLLDTQRDELRKQVYEKLFAGGK